MLLIESGKGHLAQNKSVYRSYMAFDPHTRTGSDTVERERYSVVPFFESGP